MAVEPTLADPATWLELPLYLGQRSSTFEFTLLDKDGVRKAALNPERGSAPSLSHDADSTISRRLSGLRIGVEQAGLIDPVSDRVEVAMVLGDTARTRFPLGRYICADETEVDYTNGTPAQLTMYDEMFVIDNEMDVGFNAGGQVVDQAIDRLLTDQPILPVQAQGTDQTADQSWSRGTSRANVLKDLAVVGGYFKPWFGNNGRLQLVRAFDPAHHYRDIDLDDPPRVIRGTPSRTSGLLTAPNRFVVVSNDTTGEDGTQTAPVVGVYDIPSSAPHSILNRGFVVPETVDMQVTTTAQATVAARTLGVQQTIFEVAEVTTPPDPRHDGYNIVRWRELLWLEIGWSMALAPGGNMKHTLSRVYPLAHEDELL